MKNHKLVPLLILTLTPLILFCRVIYSQEACDTDIVVIDSSSCQTEFASEPLAILSLLNTTIQKHISHYYADSRNTILMGDMDLDLHEQIDNTAKRLIMYRVDSLTSLPLAFPKELINDQASPEFDRSPSSKLNPDGKSFTIAWTANEFVNGTLHYGTKSGNYTGEAVQPKFNKRNEVTTESTLNSGTLYYGQIEMVDLSGNVAKSPEFTFGAKSGKPLVLIYAGLDNNLGDNADNLTRLISNVEQGAHGGISTRLFLDGPKEDDSYIYAVEPDKAGTINPLIPSCSGVYVEGTNCWKGDEDSAHPFALYTFLNDAIEAHRVENGNETQVILSLVGHGSGWGANVLPGQPSRWDEQPSRWDEQPEGIGYTERIGGLLWDDNPGNGDKTSRSMSTKGLGQALKWVQNETGRNIDLIYFDACSMGMAEVAYEVRDAASFMLASPNTAWSSFAYKGMLQSTKGTQTTQEIGEAWLASEKAALIDAAELYPFTLALYDLGEIDELAQTANQLAASLITLIEAHRSEMKQAYQETEHYESDYDGAIKRGTDTYGDLASFSLGIENRVGGGETFDKHVRAMKASVGKLIKGTEFQSGPPWQHPNNQWTWDQAAGLGIYLPLDNDEDKRKLYTADNLAWAADTQWDEFLARYWGETVHAANDELPVCISTRNDDCTTLVQLKENIEPDAETKVLWEPVPETAAVTPTPVTPTPVTPAPAVTATPVTPTPVAPVPTVAVESQDLFLPLVTK